MLFTPYIRHEFEIDFGKIKKVLYGNIIIFIYINDIFFILFLFFKAVCYAVSSTLPSEHGVHKCAVVSHCNSVS